MNILTRVLVLPFITLCGLLAGCEDPVPTGDYKEEIVVQSFLFVGEPINDVRIHRSQPVLDTFRLPVASIRNAVVTIETDSQTLPLEYVDDTTGGFYRAIDTAYRILPETTYRLRIVVDGKTLTGTTTTPITFAFTVPPKDTLIYPGKDKETQLFDSLYVRWTAVAPAQEYVPGIVNLDTTNYGSYLTPSTDEPNARVRDDEFDEGTRLDGERARYALAQTTSIPTVWRFFKWYGRHELVIYAGDKNFVNWFRQVGFGGRTSFSYQFNSVEGGLGVFGSAAVLRYPVFLKKKP